MLHKCYHTRPAPVPFRARLAQFGDGDSRLLKRLPVSVFLVLRRACTDSRDVCSSAGWQTVLSSRTLPTLRQTDFFSLCSRRTAVAQVVLVDFKVAGKTSSHLSQSAAGGGKGQAPCSSSLLVYGDNCRLSIISRSPGGSSSGRAEGVLGHGSSHGCCCTTGQVDTGKVYVKSLPPLPVLSAVRRAITGAGAPSIGTPDDDDAAAADIAYSHALVPRIIESDSIVSNTVLLGRFYVSMWSVPYTVSSGTQPCLGASCRCNLYLSSILFVIATTRPGDQRVLARSQNFVISSRRTSYGSPGPGLGGSGS